MLATPDRIRQDRRLIGQTLFKLALPRLTVLAVGIIIALAIWFYVSSLLLNYVPSLLEKLGNLLGLDWLQRALGQSGADLLNRIIHYLPWIPVVIWTIIVFYILKSLITTSQAAVRRNTLDSRVLAQLRPRLCDEVVEVMRWVWNERDEPFTVGDLQHTHRELRGNRTGKIALVREQSAILDQEAIAATGGGNGAETPTHAQALRTEPLFDQTR